MTEKKKRGRKKELPTARKINLFLDEASIWKAYKIGKSSISKGVRMAVAAWAMEGAQ